MFWCAPSNHWLYPFSHFSARKHAPVLWVQPTWPKWEVGCKKIPNFDEKSPKKPLREVTATPTPIRGLFTGTHDTTETVRQVLRKFAKRLHPGRPVLGVSLVDQGTSGLPSSILHRSPPHPSHDETILLTLKIFSLKSNLSFWGFRLQWQTILPVIHVVVNTTSKLKMKS